MPQFLCTENSGSFLEAKSMKIVNYNPDQIEKYMKEQILGEKLEQQRDYSNALKWFWISIGVTILLNTIMGVWFVLDDALPMWIPIIPCVIALLVSIAFAIVVWMAKPDPYDLPEHWRSFCTWFHERAKKYKILDVTLEDVRGNTRLLFTLEKENGDILNCTSPYVTMIQSTQYSEDTLDVSTGVLYKPYIANGDQVKIIFEKGAAL